MIILAYETGKYKNLNWELRLIEYIFLYYSINKVWCYYYYYFNG